MYEVKLMRTITRTQFVRVEASSNADAIRKVECTNPDIADSVVADSDVTVVLGAKSLNQEGMD